MADDQGPLVRFDQVDVAVRRPEQGGRPGQDRLEQQGRVVPVEEREGGLVERAQVRVVARVAIGRRPTLGLGQVQRAVGHHHQRVLGPPIVRVAGDADADRHQRATGRHGHVRDGAADPDGHLVGDLPVGRRQDHHELVAAVAVQAVAVPRRLGERVRDRDQEGIAGRMAARVVERLEAVEVEHHHRERLAVAGLEPVAQLALEGPVVAQPGQRVEVGPDLDRAVRLGVLEGDRGLPGEQLGQLELVRAEGRLGLAAAADVERADGLAADDERDDDHRLRLERRAGHLDGPRVEVRLVGQDRLAVVHDPAGDPGTERDLVGQDRLGELVARDDRPPDPGGPVGLVDGQRVVRDDRLERIGDEVEHAGRLERGQQSLVDLEQPALALQLMLELHPLATEPLDVLAVDQGLGRVAGEDRQGRLVVGIEPVAALLGHDDDAVDGPVEGHRDEQHRLGLLGRPDDDRPRVGRGVAEPDRLAVRRDPAGQAATDRDAEVPPDPGCSRPGRCPGRRSARTSRCRGRPGRPGSCRGRRTRRPRRRSRWRCR